MNKLLGYSLVGVGLPGFLFFLKYKGNAIPLEEFWFILSFFTMVAGVYFLAKYKLKKLNSQRNNSNPGRLAEIEQLKRTGDQIRVTLDNAEVKTRSYQQEIVQDGIPSRTEIADGLFDSNRNYRSQEICQTYIVVYKQYSGKTFKYISPSISQDAETLKLYLERQKGIDLYIDPKNPMNYYFDLPFVCQ